MKTNPIQNRYKLAMIPALLMGIITNIYIFGIIVLVEAHAAIFSPLIGVVLFLVLFFLLKFDKINAKQSFLFAAYLVVVEVCIHTHFLGWNSGFFYFLFLLPIVFLLNPLWRTWMIIFFNSSVAIMLILLFYYYHNESSYHNLDTEIQTLIHNINLVGICFIILVIIVYFSRTISKKDEALINANLKLEHKNREILKQHQSLQILIKEIHHRVKNNLQIISSLLSLQRNSVDDSEVVKILDESQRRIEAIALIHQKLYQDNNFNQVCFNAYLQDLLNSQKVINPEVEYSLNSIEVNINLDTAVPLGLIISELIANSIKHAFNSIDNPSLTITLSKLKKQYELIIQDNGIGLPENFQLNQTTSLGTVIIQALIDQISAKIEFSNDNGAQFKIYFQ
jgi:two-component sensor histidine kinase